jgi:hypothetical protein
VFGEWRYIFIVYVVQMYCIFNTLLINCPRLSPNIILIAYVIMKISQDDLFGYCMTFEICI